MAEFVFEYENALRASAPLKYSRHIDTGAFHPELLTSDVRALAQAAWGPDRPFTRESPGLDNPHVLPVLADALDDAGANPEFTSRLRRPDVNFWSPESGVVRSLAYLPSEEVQDRWNRHLLIEERQREEAARRAALEDERNTVEAEEISQRPNFDKRRIVSVPRGSWRWQNAYKVVAYVPRQTRNGTWVWARSHDVTGKMSMPQLNRHGYTVIRRGSAHHTPLNDHELRHWLARQESSVE